jgi:hypothetical protein
MVKTYTSGLKMSKINILSPELPLMKYSNKRRLVSIRRVFRASKSHWLILTTIAIIASAFLVFVLSKKISDAAMFGDFLAGFVGSLAFLWLVASFRQQGTELALQRDELSLQRRALELQTKELRNMGEFAALEQVNHIIESTLKKLSDGPEGTNKPSKLLMSCMPSEEWKILLESTDPKEVVDAYKEYLEKTGPAHQFVASIASASRLYLKATGNTYVDFSLPDIKFLYINKSWIEKIPHISAYSNFIFPVAESLTLIEPGIKSMNLAGFIAMQKLFSTNIMKEDGIKELIEYHKNNNKELPAIAK